MHDGIAHPTHRWKQRGVLLAQETTPIGPSLVSLNDALANERRRRIRMSKLTSLVAAIVLANGAHTLAQSAAPSETELAKVVADCNGAANSGKARALRACETLDKQGRLSLAQPAAVTAYQRYQQERLAACRQRAATPRGQSRPSNCGP
jgi:hypothetical protein